MFQPGPFTTATGGATIYPAQPPFSIPAPSPASVGSAAVGGRSVVPLEPEGTSVAPATIAPSYPPLPVQAPATTTGGGGVGGGVAMVPWEAPYAQASTQRLLPPGQTAVVSPVAGALPVPPTPTPPPPPPAAAAHDDRTVAFAPPAQQQQQQPSSSASASRRTTAALKAAEASQLQAKVRVLEHEVQTLRKGLAVASSTAAAAAELGQTPGRRRAAGPGAGAASGRPEIAFGRRVQPTTALHTDAALSSSPARQRPFSATRGPSRRRVTPTGRAAAAVPLTPPPPQQPQQQKDQKQPVVVAVSAWRGGSREIALQGDAAGASIMPCAAGDAAAATSAAPAVPGRYWLSSDPHLASHQRAPAPAATAAAATTRASTEVVQLSPTTSVDSIAVLLRQQQQQQQQEVGMPGVAATTTTGGTATATTAAAAESEVASLRRLVDDQRAIIERQEQGMRAMAAALVDLEQRHGGAAQEHPPAGITVHSWSPAPASQLGIGGGGGSAAGSGPVPGLEKADALGPQRQAAILSLSLQLAAETKSRAAAEAALEAERAEGEKMHRALETLKREHGWLSSATASAAAAADATGSAAALQASPQPPSNSNSNSNNHDITSEAAMRSDSGAAETQRSSEPSRAPPAADAELCELRAQVSQLTAKLKAWERWYVKARQAEGRHGGGANRRGGSAASPPTTGCGGRPWRASSSPPREGPPYYPAYTTHTGGERGSAGGDGGVAAEVAHLRAWRSLLLQEEAVSTRQGGEATAAENKTTAATGDGAAAVEQKAGNHTTSGLFALHTPEGARALVPLESNDDDLVTFIAKQQALREMAMVEREAAEERLMKLRGADEMDAKRAVEGASSTPS